MIRNILQTLLRWLASSILKRYRPEIIAITGSIGKTSTKEACFDVLSNKFRVRRNLKNYNTEIGITLTIIGADAPARSVLKWLKVFLQGFFMVLIKSKKYPQILILELAADRPGDIRYFMTFIKPKISIITTLSQVHLANFSKFSQIIAEKKQIIENLDSDGYAILNYDDERVRQLALKTKAKVITYSLNNDEVNLRALEAKVIQKQGNLGLYFKLMYKGTVTPIFVKDLIARHQVYNLLAAAACGAIHNLTPLEIAQGLESFKSVTGRFTIACVREKIWLIDDTYNAAPVSTCAALECLRDLPIGKRRIAVLGDMLELGSYSDQGHHLVGKCAARCAVDLLVTYGESARLISKTAEEAGLHQSQIHHFDTQRELLKFLKPKLKKEDVVLVKGSHGMKMEQVVKSLKIR